MVDARPQFEPGQRVAVVQQIPHRDQVWTTRVEGTVHACEQRKTGAWFAHARDRHLWLDRLTLVKADGEVVECILDAYSRVEILDGGRPADADAAAVPRTPATATPKSAG